MMRQTILVILFFAIQLAAFSQGNDAKPGCNPSACKPGNTKVAEAGILTDLRSELETIQMRWENEFGNLNIDLSAGLDDKKSLDKMIKATEQMKSVMNITISETFTPRRYSTSPARRAAELKEEISMIKEKLNSTQ